MASDLPVADRDRLREGGFPVYTWAVTQSVFCAECMTAEMLACDKLDCERVSWVRTCPDPGNREIPSHCEWGLPGSHAASVEGLAPG